MAGQQPKTQRLFNRSKGLRYVNGLRLMPDDKGIEVTAEQLEGMKKNAAFVARLQAGEYEVK